MIVIVMSGYILFVVVTTHIFIYFFSVDPNAPDFHYNQPKFIVFYEMLLKIFLLFCFNCKAANPQVTMRQQGTMVTVKQQCMNCIKGYVWNSQSFMPHGKYPTGNVLLLFYFGRSHKPLWSKVHEYAKVIF